jgi:hypothetical protein
MGLLRKLIKGVTSMTSTQDTKDIILPSIVNKNKTMVTLKISNPNGENTTTVNASNYMIVGEINTAGDTLTISRARHTDQAMNINYQIWYFKNATVTHGSTVIDNVNKEVILSSYTANKTFSVFTMKGNRAWDANNAAFLCILHRAYNNGSNNVLNLKGNLSAGTMTAYYQIVECQDFTVDRYYVSLTSSSSYDLTLSPSVTMSKTMCMLSNYYASSIGLSKLKCGRLYDASTFRFYSFAAVTSDHNLYIIKCTRMTIERGYELFSTATTNVDLSVNYNYNRLFINNIGQNMCWICVNDTNVNHGDFGVRIMFYDSPPAINDFDIERGFSYVSSAAFWEAGDFFTMKDNRRITKGCARGKVRGM